MPRTQTRALIHTHERTWSYRAYVFLVSVGVLSKVDSRSCLLVCSLWTSHSSVVAFPPVYHTGGVVLVLLFASLSSGGGWKLLLSSKRSLLSSLFSHCVLYHQSPTPVFCCVLHSPPTLSRSLLTQSSHRIIGLPRLLSPPLFGHLISMTIFHILFFPILVSLKRIDQFITWPVHINTSVKQPTRVCRTRGASGVLLKLWFQETFFMTKT